MAVILVYTTTNFAGAAFFAHAIYFIIEGLPAIHAFDVSIGGFGLACITIVVSWLIVDKIRNRSAFYAGIVVKFIAMLTVGALYYNKSPGALWAVAMIM